MPLDTFESEKMEVTRRRILLQEAERVYYNHLAYVDVQHAVRFGENPGTVLYESHGLLAREAIYLGN